MCESTNLTRLGCGCIVDETVLACDDAMQRKQFCPMWDHRARIPITDPPGKHKGPCVLNRGPVPGLGSDSVQRQLAAANEAAGVGRHTVVEVRPEAPAQEVRRDMPCGWMCRWCWGGNCVGLNDYGIISILCYDCEGTAGERDRGGGLDDGEGSK